MYLCSSLQIHFPQQGVRVRFFDFPQRPHFGRADLVLESVLGMPDFWFSVDTPKTYWSQEIHVTCSAAAALRMTCRKTTQYFCEHTILIQANKNIE